MHIEAEFNTKRETEIWASVKKTMLKTNIQARRCAALDVWRRNDFALDAICTHWSEIDVRAITPNRTVGKIVCRHAAGYQGYADRIKIIIHP